MSDYGKPLHDNIQYCVRCCMPETSEGINFDEMGICRGCRSAEDKMHINWVKREKKLREILDKFRGKNIDNYDCVVPISGGKDSAFQLHTLVKVYKMKPLAVTFSHNWYSKTGKYNLENILERLNVDHLMFTPNRELVNKIAKQSLYAIGDSCWNCHAGIGAFPLKAAMMMKIPLMIWGESICEAGNKAAYGENNYGTVKFDQDYYLKVSTKVSPEKMISDEITRNDLIPYLIPSKDEVEKAGIVGLHLGDYIFWDGERQTEFIKKEYDWQEDDVDGTYKRYKSVECIMPGVHDYSKYIKRGFGRTTDHVSQDVRAGLLSREEGFELIKEIETKRPDSLDYYLEITGFTEEEFYKVLKKMRNSKAELIKD